jgi:hypothetical protein
MTQVPIWLAFVTPAVALIALCVSIGSLVVAFRTYRRAGPSVIFLHASDGKQYGYALLINNGLAKVQVYEVFMAFHGRIFSLAEPFWLEGGETKRVAVPLSSAQPDVQPSGDLEWAHVVLGNGDVIPKRIW